MRPANKRGDAPTARQREILETLARLHTELRQPPTVGDVARALGISRAGARRQIRALEAKGLIIDEPIQVFGNYRLTMGARMLLTGG